MSKHERQASAFRIRDSLLPEVLQNGRTIDVAGRKLVRWERGDFMAVLHSPFARLHGGLPAPSTYQQAVLLQNVQPLGDSGLDVWLRSKKVLSLTWDAGKEPTEIISFKRDSWEQELLDLLPDR